MNSIWKEALLSKEFEENGYVVIDFLDKNSIEKLKKIHTESELSVGNTFYSSSFIPDKQLKKRISEAIEKIIDPFVEEQFVDYKKLGAVFLVKPSGQNTEMPIHQDWTVVDERQFQSITIWIPLQDTTSQNGAIKVLPKSHQLSHALRSPTLNDPLQNIKNIAEKWMVPLPMKAGQAFIFSHAILHSSFPNSSGQERIAVAYGLLHKEATLIYYFKPQGAEMLEKLRVKEDFFLNYPAPGERPEESVRIDQFKYEDVIISESHFNQYYGIENQKDNQIDFWQSLKGSIKKFFRIKS